MRGRSRGIRQQEKYGAWMGELAARHKTLPDLGKFLHEPEPGDARRGDAAATLAWFGKLKAAGAPITITRRSSDHVH